MRTAAILVFVVVTGTGGEICLTHAMKLLGEVHDFRPRAILSFVLRALRVGWLWFGVLLMTLREQAPHGGMMMEHEEHHGEDEPK